MIRLAACAVALALPSGALAQDNPWAGRPHGPVYADAVAPMDTTITTRLMPQLDALLDKLQREGRALTLDGIRIFQDGDRFLPGKIGLAMAYRTLAVPDGDPRLEQRLKEFAATAELTLQDPNDTWGIYYYMTALHALHERGLLNRAVRPETLAKLRAGLDWRRFVKPDMTLDKLPNNYYGVAFSIARLRFLVGWEEEAPGNALLTLMLDHYRKYSGTYGFADETAGKGRYDRYSVLLIGEIAHRMLETGMTPGPEVKAWLRRSVDLLLQRFNLSGEGFEYGRSIGTYGETAFLEVLTAAALLKVLTPEEERMSYAFSSRIAARYMDFWIDPATGSVNMWDHGRRIDGYRHKARIFGENLSLGRQFLYTNAIWNRAGYRGSAPDTGYARWLAKLSPVTMTWFARGEHDRAVLTIRDGDHVIGLPLINGAEGYHMNNPYFPVPFSPGMLQGSPDARYPQLLPKITLADGSVLMPLAWFKDVRMTRRGRVTEIRWRQDTLDLMGDNDARQDGRVSIETSYRFAPGEITRSDRLVPAKGVKIAQIEMEFAGYSSTPSQKGPAAMTFAQGEVRGFVASGYGACTAAPASDPVYRSPTGPFATLVRCARKLPIADDRSLTLYWRLSYNSASRR
ncbi:MAG: hypothetical protein V4808_06575 [Pseudomonadota bacterium]